MVKEVHEIMDNIRKLRHLMELQFFSMEKRLEMVVTTYKQEVVMTKSFDEY